MLKKELRETKTLLQEIPAVALTLYALSVVMMNLLANKSVTTPFSWLALDAGIVMAWLPFLTMDIITKHFGAKASIKVSIVVILINLLASGIFLLATNVPGNWGESYAVAEGAIVNTALDNTFGGTWYVLLGSTIAFFVSTIVDAQLNEALGKLTAKLSAKKSFYIRSYLSTAFGQFVDNLVFSLIVSINFFGWTAVQCIMCSLTGAVVELLLEVAFSPIGYRISNKWIQEGVGKNYLAHLDS